jgi:hypothetical protein
MNIVHKFHHYSQWVLQLSTVLLSLTIFLQEEAYYCLIDIDHLDADAKITHSFLSITSPSENTFKLTYKLSLKDPPRSDLLAFTPSNRIASAWKALDGAGVLIMPTNLARRSTKLKWETVLA